MNLGNVASRVRAGETVTFKASGNSMAPRIKGGATVTVEPIYGALPEKGDVVLVKICGYWMLHLVTGLRKREVQISNNHGHVNGLTKVDNVVGKLIS